MRLSLNKPTSARIKCVCDEPEDGYRFKVASLNLLRCATCNALVQITPTPFREIYHDDYGIFAAMEE